jgi:hypothetical protein
MFGTIQYLLLLVPGVGLLFLCSNAAATALWCADLSKELEARRGSGSGSRENVGQPQSVLVHPVKTY